MQAESVPASWSPEALPEALPEWCSFQVGELVCISGLQLRTDLNGEIVRVLAAVPPLPWPDTQGRYEVEVMARRRPLPQYGGGREVVRVKARNIFRVPHAPVAPGTFVLLHSLSSRPELNGTSAEVVHFPDEECDSARAARAARAASAASVPRCHVELPTGERVAVKRECILVQAHPAASSRAPQSKRSQCCVCLTEDAEMTVAVACGHLCACVQCARSIGGGGSPCPICRRPVERFIKVFASGCGE